MNSKIGLLRFIENDHAEKTSIIIKGGYAQYSILNTRLEQISLYSWLFLDINPLILNGYDIVQETESRVVNLVCQGKKNQVMLGFLESY